RHLGGDVPFVAAEVDHPVALLVAPAPEPDADASAAVAAARPLLGLGERLLRRGLGDLLEGEAGHEAPAGRRRSVFLEWHRSLRQACSKNSIIFSPCFSTTYAFFQSARRPTCRPWRFTLPWTLATRTSCSFTPNRVSTAFLISGLEASRWTSKQSERWVSLRAVVFSVMSGRRMTSYMFFMA